MNFTKKKIKKQSKAVLNKSGEGYVDVAVTVMIVTFVLIFVVNMISLVALNQNLKTIADQLVDRAAVKGTVDIEDYVKELYQKHGIDFTWSFEGSELSDSDGKVQLGDQIVCTVRYRLTLPGFGDAIHIADVNASASGLSQVYWK